MVRGDAIIHKKPLGLDGLCVRRKCPVTNSLGRNAERVKGMSNERTSQTAGIKFLFYFDIRNVRIFQGQN